MSSLFNNLPAELYDEICEHLVEEEWELLEYKSTRPRRYAIHTFDHVINVYRRPLDRRLLEWPQPGAIQLRLVNRAFNRAMMRVYFRYNGLIVHATQESALKRFEEDVFRDDTKSWSIANAVGKLNVSFGTGQYRGGSIFDAEHGPEDEWDKENRTNEKLDECAERLKVFLDEGMLSRAVQMMPRLESLILQIPQSWRSNQPISYETDYDWKEAEADENYAAKFAPKFRLDLIESLREDIGSMFKTTVTPKLPSSIGVERGLLQSLTYLHLTLPCSYDMAHIGSCIPDTMALRLRHLYMEIIDGTGPGGDNDYTHHWQGDYDSDGDEDHPYSNLQLQYHNSDHFSDMCAFVNRCKNLESLGLVGTQRIELEGLNFQSMNGGLKNIYFSRVLCTAEELLSLLPSHNGEGIASNIEAFDVEESELWDGTWEAVFARLVAAPSLVHFRIYNLIYSKHGLSSHFHEHNNRVWENGADIWTVNDDDRARLYDVIKAMKDRGRAVDDDMETFFQEHEEQENHLASVD